MPLSLLRGFREDGWYVKWGEAKYLWTISHYDIPRRWFYGAAEYIHIHSCISASFSRMQNHPVRTTQHSSSPHGLSSGRPNELLLEWLWWCKWFNIAKRTTSLWKGVSDSGRKAFRPSVCSNNSSKPLVDFLVSASHPICIYTPFPLLCPNRSFASAFVWFNIHSHIYKRRSANIERVHHHRGWFVGGWNRSGYIFG